ncbi:unnamed protein product [Leuciscus chuanchicus]
MDRTEGGHEDQSGLQKGPESGCEREDQPCAVPLSTPLCQCALWRRCPTTPHPCTEQDKCQRYCNPAEALKSPVLFVEKSQEKSPSLSPRLCPDMAPSPPAFAPLSP